MIATKQILQMCNTNINYKKEAIILGSLDPNNVCEINTSDPNFKSYKKEFYQQVEINGTIYRLGTFLVSDMRQSETEFGEIIKILKINNVIYFYTKIYEEVTFDYSYHAYNVHNKNVYKLCKYEELPVIAPCLSIKIKNNHFIATRYVL